LVFQLADTMPKTPRNPLARIEIVDNASMAPKGKTSHNARDQAIADAGQLEKMVRPHTATDIVEGRTRNE